MDTKNKKLILIFSFLFILTLGSLFFFNDTLDEVNEDNKTKEEDSYTGNLIMGNPGLEEGWYISYEEEGSPGLIKKLIISEEVECINEKTNCQKLVEESEDLAGKRVMIEGKKEDDNFVVSRVEFLKEEGCNFEFSDFETTTTTDDNDYKVDFSTKPEAENFRTRIKDAVSEGPNFAGDYVYAGWGCGTNCGAGAIVNPKSGEIVEYGLVNTRGIEFKKDSNLLIINPKKNLNANVKDTKNEITSKYFIMQEDSLLLLCEEKI